MFKSAILKFTLWYVALIMLLSLAFSLVLYHFSIGELQEGLHKQYSELTKDDHDQDDYIKATNLEYNQRADHLRLVFIDFNLVVLLSATGVSYFLAKRTLNPIIKSHQAQVRFTAQASHELRTPLTAMRADTESVLLSNSTDTVLLRKTLKANLVDLDRLDKLSSHLLEVAKYRSLSPIKKETFDLNEIVSQVIHQAQRLKQNKDRRIIFKGPKIDIVGDPISIELVVSTVLDNALKYSNPLSEIKINLSLDSNNKAVLVIINDGPGIDPKELSFIFEPFYRSSLIAAKSNNSNKGYGLGLTLAKEIVEHHRGKIFITSQINGLTIVTITLPK